MQRLNADRDYPLSEKRPELIDTPTGKKLSEITMENVLTEKVGVQDCRISAKTLEYQAQIAESAGNSQMAHNFRRAAELTFLTDERVLEIYSALRPYNSSKQELLGIAEKLEAVGAVLNAQYIKEAASVYEKRNKFRGDK